MVDTPETQAGASDFAAAVQALRSVGVRAEIELEEVPAPARLAPRALALAGEVVDPVAGGEQVGDVELASGRFVLLHDPSGPSPWEGVWRVVLYARAQLDPSMADDPVLAEVGWAWLREALERRGARSHALAGTVTRVVNERFGDLSDDPRTIELEVRASWTPTGPPSSLGSHLLSWCDVLSELAGLPPVPDGVVVLPTARW